MYSSVACSLRSDVYKEPADTTKKWTDQETLRLLEVCLCVTGTISTYLNTAYRVVIVICCLLLHKCVSCHCHVQYLY